MAFRVVVSPLWFSMAGSRFAWLVIISREIYQMGFLQSLNSAFFLQCWQIKRKKASAAGARPEAGEGKGRERKGF